MRMRLITILAAVLGGGTFWSSEMASAAEIKVLSSQAIKEAYLAFAPEFERMSGHKLNTTWNGTVDILKKLRAGEAFDMVILVTPAMETMIKEGKIVGATAASIWFAPASPSPSRRARRNPTSARPTRSSGRCSRPRASAIRPARAACSSKSLFKRWGIWDQIAAKIKQTPPGTPVGSMLARGDVDIGFQQVSELLLYPGIQYVGPVPKEMDTSACSPAACTPARSSPTRRAS